MVPRFEVVVILVIGVQGLKFQTENDPSFGKTWMYFLDENNIPQKVYLEMPYSRLTPFALEEDEVAQLVNFTLYTRKSPEGNPVTFNPANLTKSGFQPFRKTKSVTHGWLSSGTADTCITIKDEYLKRADLNVFVMDWSAISKNVMYPIPMANTPGVGKHYAKFLDFLMANGAKGGDIHLVGHSLGAHISGYAAKYVSKGSVGRVTALDPAGVGFKESEYKEGLPETFVDVIHTTSGILGLREKVGDIDFYPNGGVSPQPGCNVLDQFGVGCSHGRSWKLFAESINGAISMGTRCQSWGDYQNRRCGGMRAPMGDPVSVNAEFGSYFLDTNGEVPYMRSNNE